MFDKLIESNSVGADFKPRRTFFMVSFVVVGIVFLSALVFDLYAANIDLGIDKLELVEILAPVDTDAPKPEPPPRQPQQRNEQQSSERPSRQALIDRIDQPQQAPTTISTTPSTHLTIPEGAFDLNAFKPESDGRGAPTGPANSGTVGSSSAEAASQATVVADDREPPPAVKPEPKRTVMKSEGVINGKATYLPAPPYPAPAKMVGAFGVVNVQVVIDEDGKVISSKAVSGHPLLRQTAESAAWKAKFSTTYLSRVPVKVTGVIVYNFKKS